MSGRRFGGAAAAKERGVDVVQLGAARERIEPDVLLTLTIVQRAQAKATLQEEPEGTCRRRLELGDGEGVARRARIEDGPAAGTWPSNSVNVSESRCSSAVASARERGE